MLDKDSKEMLQVFITTTVLFISVPIFFLINGDISLVLMVVAVLAYTTGTVMDPDMVSDLMTTNAMYHQKVFKSYRKNLEIGKKLSVYQGVQ